MTYKGLHNNQYTAGRELGKGGEGAVYEVREDAGLALKKYNEPPGAEQIAKLRLMALMHTPAIAAYAAWPHDIVMDGSGQVCGFTMKKLAGYLPLHMVFSPMDRKRMFPDKGYNFLVHIARNLATAFHKLHEAGLVVGDVNEGNILINAAGMVAFIDCDSFQVQQGKKYFFCEVGVPRYTPPELLKKGSFERVVRTVNTDAFSLGILLFQLLFLGRHPYAGKHKLAADIDEETAIKKKEFAYSLHNKKRKLSPPENSFAITDMPDDIISLFHQCFEQDERPRPAQWIKALDGLLLGMVSCGMSALHTYPAQLAECPWCYFSRVKGILYFLDDSYLHAGALPGDIETFVNGFELEKLELKKWQDNKVYTGIAPAPIERKYYRYYRLKTAATIGVAALGVLSLYILPWLAILLFPLAFWVYKYSAWMKRLEAELARRKAAYRQLDDRQAAYIREYDHPADLDVYNKTLSVLLKLTGDFRKIQGEYERRKKMMEELVYREQLSWYLAMFDLESHPIASFGPAKKAALYSFGITTAADIDRLPGMKIPGIGPRNLQALLGWQRQMVSGFVYIPDSGRIAAGMQQVDEDMARIRTNLEATIRREYKTLNYLKMNIANRAAVLARHISDVSEKARQAAADHAAFRRLAA